MRSMLGSWPTRFSKGPDEVGGGIWVKLLVLASMGGGLPIPEGGSEKLIEALVRLITDPGASSAPTASCGGSSRTAGRRAS